MAYSVWEIDEGHTKFLHAMKLVPPKDLGSIGHPGNIHWKHFIEALFTKSTGTIHFAYSVF